MKLLKVLLAFAILSIGISSVLAAQDVVRNSVSTAAGRIDYAMTYDPVAGGTTVSAPVVNLHATDSIISAFITGTTIDKAKDIDSYLLAVSSGGDVATTGMEAKGADVAGKYASVKNYCMYGYVTNNLAYAGQYADEIKGQSIEMYSKSFNNLPAAPAAIAAPNTEAKYTTYAGAVVPGTAEHNIAWVDAGSINPLSGAVVTDANTAAYTATQVYQFAQSGGSKDSTAYSMGKWAQAVNYNGGKLTTAGATSGDFISESTYGGYKASSGPWMDASTDIWQTTTATDPAVIISPNYVDMGYADHDIVYSNEDSSFSAISPAYRTVSTNNLVTGTPHSTSLQSAAKPAGFLQSGLFVYSIVDKNSPVGKSDAVPIITKLYGLDFGPYMDGQSPNNPSISQISEDQIRARMKIIAPYTEWIRTYGCDNGLENAGRIAHEMGLKAAIGVYLDKKGIENGENEKQKTNLENAAKAGQVDMIIVGNEPLSNNLLSEDQLVGYITEIKNEIPGIPVTTADTYNVILSNPRILSSVDAVFANYYPWWEGKNVNQALGTIASEYTEAAAGKKVIVSETGWPSGPSGNYRDNAVSSPENAAKYFADFVGWARANNVPYFYFEAFDESWKADPADPNNEGPQGAYWGIWDKNGNLKPGM